MTSEMDKWTVITSYRPLFAAPLKYETKYSRMDKVKFLENRI